MNQKNPAAVALGGLGGAVNSPAQQAARARNCKLGGWPKGRKRGKRHIVAEAEPTMNPSFNTLSQFR